MPFKRIILSLLILAITSSVAEAKIICTVIADAETGKFLQQQGDCRTRVTPASTFKIAISLMGYDSGILKNAHDPVMLYRAGYADWGGATWREPTDPTRWIKYSVFWFSHQVVDALGQDRFQQYTRQFQYGNQDVSRKLKSVNRMEDGAWVNSSLRISPLEQITFLKKVVNRQLPVSAHAFDMTNQITRLTALANGWDIHGKPGTGSPGSDGSYDKTHAYGWFVGWAIKGNRKIVFARLIQDEKAEQDNAGLRARDTLLKELPAVLDQSINALKPS